jgi:hypothetical protein
VGTYDIAAGTQNWDVPLNANLDAIDGRLTNAENKNTTQDSQIATIQGQITGFTNNPSYKVYNVKSPTYGALGDGSHDDTVAIQAALNAANAAGGGVVYLPAGQYKISSALTMYNRITLRGDGDYVTNIVQTNTAAHGLVGASLIYVIIEHLRLTGPGTGTGEGINFTTEFDYCILRDMSATSWGSTGIEIEQPIVTNLTRVTSFSNGGAGIFIHGNATTGAGTSVSFDSCWTHDNISNGFSIQNMTYCSFQACASDNQTAAGKAGYRIDQCTGFTFSGCGSEGNNFGWLLTGASTGIVFNSPYIFNTPSTGVGIYASAATNVQIIGATEALPQAGATAAVQVDTGSTCTIQGLVATTANVLASGTTVLAQNSSGVRSYPNGVTTPTLTMTGNIAMGSNKVTGLANGSASSDAAAFGQIPTPGSVTAQTSYGASSANGSAATFSRSDHTHGTVSVPSAGAFSSVSENTSLATQQASANLVVPVVANATYLLRMNLLVSQATSSFVHSWTGPTGATMVWADNSGSVMATIGATDTWSSIASRTITLTGKLITSSTAGNLTFTYASGTAGQTVTIQPGAQINLERIA